MPPPLFHFEKEPLLEQCYGWQLSCSLLTPLAAAPPAPLRSRLDTIMNLLPGRAKAASAEPNDEAIRRTHDYLR